MSNFEIYDDQHGKMIHPVIGTTINEKMKSFFIKKIRLYIEKAENGQLNIICNISAHEKMERIEGYYLSYRDTYTENSFTKFKKDSERSLTSLGFHLKSGLPADNIIFNNIEKFDLGVTIYDKKIPEDYLPIIQALNDGNVLTFKGGRIDDIADFCRIILQNTKAVKIVLSSREEKSEEGDIDIFLDKKFEENIAKTIETEKILQQKHREMEEERAREENEKRNSLIDKERINIESSIIPVKECLEHLKDIGCDISYAKKDLSRFEKDIIMIKYDPFYASKREKGREKSYEEKREESLKKYEGQGNSEKRPQTQYNPQNYDNLFVDNPFRDILKIIAIIVSVAAILAVIVFLIMPQFEQKNFENDTAKDPGKGVTGLNSSTDASNISKTDPQIKVSANTTPTMTKKSESMKS
ncbi:MAG: hypothetical protein C3F06_10590 [Candidatus Methanoperedenaceae archaeon]|nr:MAG: hypothetical protein C3F06_10590 [Candidatus Methanoperedenaceae archaeon]